MGTAECSHRVRPLPGQTNAGDAAWCLRRNNLALVALIDALGHGDEAHAEALAVLDALNGCVDFDPCAMLQRVHRARNGGRGSACALAALDIRSGVLKFASVGNVFAVAFNGSWSSLVSNDGTLGHRMDGPLLQTVTFLQRGLLFLYSDGVSNRGIQEHPEQMFQGEPSEVTARYLRHYGKSHDDASCLLLRFRGVVQ